MTGYPSPRIGDVVVIISVENTDIETGISVGSSYEVARCDKDHVWVKTHEDLPAYPMRYDQVRPGAPDDGYQMKRDKVSLDTRAEPSVGALTGDLTLRDYFAAHALSGLGHWRCVEELAALAYTTADAMLKERSK